MAKHTRKRQNKTRHKKKSIEQKYKEKAPNKYKSKKTKLVVTPVEAK
jgi:hypothetical protein